MNADQLNEELKAMHDQINALSHLWEVAIGPCPSDQQFCIWLGLHPFERLIRAIRETARKQSKRQVKMDADHLVRFCSRMANDRKTVEERAAA